MNQSTKQLRITSIKKINKRDRYDLTINSTRNFFANGVLIHNTSGRYTYTDICLDLP